QISEDNDEWIDIEKMSSNPFWPKISKNPILHIRKNASCNSSKPVPLTYSLSSLVQADSDYFHFDIDVSEYHVSVKISDYFDGSAAVLLVNNLNNRVIRYGQTDVKHRYELLPNHNILFTWHDLNHKTTLSWALD